MSDKFEFPWLKSLSAEARSTALRELVTGSPNKAAIADCLEAILSLAPAEPQPRHSGTLKPGWKDRILASTKEHATVDSDLLQSLVKEEPSKRRLLAAREPRCHEPAFCRALLLHAQTMLFRTPVDALDLTQLACDIAAGPHLRVDSEALLCDLQGRCYAFLGNALRARSQFQEAETCFRKAHRYLQTGTGDPGEQARLSDFESHLCWRQARFAEGLRHSDRAIRLFKRVGDLRGAAVAVVSKALLVRDAGDIDEGIRLNREALEMIDPEVDPRLRNIARHNIAVGLKTRGDVQEAANELESLREAHASLGDTINLIKVRHLEAEVLFGLGRVEEAIVAARDARADYLEHGMLVDFAWATLDLARYHLELGQLRETRLLAAESLPCFRSLGIHREAMAAFLVFQEAAEREAATVELVREIAAFLRASRVNPELKFRG